ncbi:serine proteinase stubble-like [Tropilaelaps mercedesae]|uniref:Serine proteinase stubble-like n=1 Tax=Tropilaelaps mercedesae TaxID=418985 RepID=A0A1V9XLY4_9ACAR|nr:serine proteinase stubble-like [Tropilaelaps mercedesae]
MRPSGYRQVIPSGALFQDLLILVLAQPTKFDSHTQPICIGYDEGSLVGEHVIVAGWGALEDASPLPSVLHFTGEIVRAGTSNWCNKSAYFGDKYEFCVYNGYRAVCKVINTVPI